MSEKIIFTARLKEERDYWVNKLSQELENQSLLLDFPRSSVYFSKKNSINLVLPDELNGKLAALTKGSDFLLYTTLMTVLKICLNWYTASRVISIGSPSYVEGGKPGGQGNVVAIMDEVDERVSFRQLLLKVRETLSEAYSRQNYPFSALLKDLGLDGVQNQCPLFSVALSFDEIHGQMPEVKTDIHLTFRKQADRIAGVINYNPRLFSSERIERFSGHLLAVLDAAVKKPEIPVHDLRLLTEEERQLLIVQANDTAEGYPAESCVHELFESCVDQVPDAIALTFDDKHLTYAELNRKANQLAHYLRQSGIGPEVCVGISLARSPEMVIGVLGCMKAGGAYAPLDSSYPQERLRLIIQDIRPPVILTQESLLASLPESASRQLCLETIWESLADYPQENLCSEAHPDNLAYIIHTSGSTGRPKGVAMPHRPLVNLMSWQLKNSTRAKTLMFAPLSFDVSFQEMFSTLSAGETLTLVPKSVRQDITALPALLEESLIERIFLPFVALQQLALAATNQNVFPLALREIITAGEQLEVTEPIVKLIRQIGETSLQNQYGPTEAHVVTAHRLNPPSSQWPTLPPIGRPVSNARIHLLDHRAQPVPAGVNGELCIGGLCLARGYLNSPDLTAERFVPDQFSQHSGGRVYQTGDLARYRLNGEIDFLGRIDDQVKIRGFRIEPAEIEAVLGRHPDVHENIVVAREDEPNQKRLVAYIVPKHQQTWSVSGLREFLTQKLPEYMVPHAFVRLEAFPLTPSGKIDRRHLPIPEVSREGIGQSFVGPRNAIEGLLAGIWSDLLRINRVGVHDNFFELGGDSILSIQMVVRANQAGLKLMPKHVFNHQTIADLAKVSETTSLIGAKQEIVTGQTPLTPVQRWFFEKGITDQHHWNMTYLFELKQAVDAASVEQAVEALLRQHDALRLRFWPNGSGFGQMMVEPTQPAPFVHFDLSAIAENRRASVIEESSARLQSSLDLSQGPLIRVALFDARPQGPQFLLITIHHLAVDGVSWRILLEDLQLGIGQSQQGLPIRLPLKTTSFKEWGEALISHARSAAVQTELDYWVDEDRQSIEPIPLDFPHGANLESSVQIVPTLIGSDETEALLQEIPKTFQVQINEVLIAALAQALRRWSGQRSLLIDVEGHGREEITTELDISRTVGWFTSIYPVMLNVPDAAPIDVLESTKRQLRQIPNRGIGYGLLRYLSQDQSANEQLKNLPQAQISFNYLGQFDQVLNKDSFFSLSFNRKGPILSPRATRLYLLYVSGGILQGRLHINFTYSENCHRRETIERVAGYFREALSELIDQCRSQGRLQYLPSDFPLAQLNRDELDEVLSEIGITGDELS